jgi:hypothetical protein
MQLCLFFPVTETEIEEVIKNFQGKYSAGIDEIPDYVVKKCIEEIKKPLARLFVMPRWNVVFFQIGLKLQN